MKQTIILICTLAYCLMNTFVFAQAPQKMSYQAVIRNASNALVTNQNVGMRISILQGSAFGTAVYVELQGATTNANGLATIQIGAGTVVSGNFSSINWGNSVYFVKTEADPLGGNSYSISSTTQFLSVPYALYAKSGGALGANGLTTLGDSVKLGGRLFENTSISQDGSSFSIKDVDPLNTATMINQTSFLPFVNLSATPILQSMTSVAVAKLADISLRVTAVAGSSITITLKNNAGTTLGTQTISYAGLFDSWQTFTFSNSIILQSSTLYNINITGTSGTVLYYSNINPYGAGASGIGVGTDIAFVLKYFVEGPTLVAANQQVGIGTASPSARLDVAGKTKTTQFQLSNGAGAGKLLISDASGNASWMNPSTAASGTLDEAYDFGSYKGAGRTIIADSGAIKIAGQDGLLVTGTINSGADVENVGGDPQLLFNPKTASFRVGVNNSNEWAQSYLANYSVAMGYNTKATGVASIALGSNTTASGTYSAAFGTYSFAMGETSFAAGFNSIASGGASVAMGYGSLASGNSGISLGTGTNAIGAGSFAAGYITKANGDVSSAFGEGTIANGYSCLAIGRHNDSIVAPQISIVPTSPLFIIGNGDYNTRSNAMVVRNNGRVGLGNNANTYQFELNTNSAAKPASSSWTISSDRRLKTVDGQYTKGLNDILKLNTIRYHYTKNNPRNLPSEPQAFGFIAQELQAVFPEAVNTDEDGYLSVDMHPVLVAYVNAFKDLSEQNAKQQSEIDQLKAQLAEIISSLKR
jgi:hypothetical protein